MTNHRIQPAAALHEEAALSGLDPLEQVTRDLLLQIGENPDREGLRRTPLRFARAWRFLTRGYDQDIVEIINNGVRGRRGRNGGGHRHRLFQPVRAPHAAVLARRMSAMSPPESQGCPRSPAGGGLQPPPAPGTHDPQTFTLSRTPSSPAAVVTEASHLCMMMRGVQKVNSNTITSAMRGVFRKNRATRAEFMDFIHQGTSR